MAYQVTAKMKGFLEDAELVLIEAIDHYESEGHALADARKRAYDDFVDGDGFAITAESYGLSAEAARRALDQRVTGWLL